MTKVGLDRGDKSYEAVTRALEAVREDVEMPGDRPVLIKPNVVVPNVELCATPVEAVRATLRLLAGSDGKESIVAEGTAVARLHFPKGKLRA